VLSGACKQKEIRTYLFDNDRIVLSTQQKAPSYWRANTGSRPRSRLPATEIRPPVAPIVVLLLTVFRRGRRTTTSSVVAPLAVTTASAEVTSQLGTLREWAKPAPGTFSTRPRSDGTSRLNQEGIDVRRSVCRHLLGCNATREKGHITSWQSQDCLLQGIVTHSS